MTAPEGPQPVSIGTAMAALTPLVGRTPTTTDEEKAEAFAELAPVRDGGIYVGHWGQGRSEWERHPADEVVAVVAGETSLTLLIDDEEVSHTLGPAQVIVVPALTWHQFTTVDMVQVITVTPQPGNHQAERPTAADAMTTSPSTPRLDALGVIATDVAASLAFYRRLGMSFEQFGEGHHEATMPSGFRLMIDDVATIESFSTYEPASGGRNVALAFACDTPAEVDAAFTATTAGGAPVKTAPFDAPWGQRYATVVDPDGNPVDLFAPQG
ncbi:MAG: VOC family protein [Acidimicrobiales bacterium]